MSQTSDPFSSFMAFSQGLRDWAQTTGLVSAAPGQAKRERGGGHDESDIDASREDFASRVQLVHMHLNLTVRPVLLPTARGRHVIRESYAEEPVFKWLLGDVHSKKDPAAAQHKRDLLLDWMVDWRLDACQGFSHCLAIPSSAQQSPSRAGGGASSPGTGECEIKGCAIVTCPGSRAHEVSSFMSLLAYGASPPTPPAALGTGCKSRFAALEHMMRARARLASESLHWYIHMVGVSPEHQGKGSGCMLMRIICALADQDALPVHIEVSGSRNRAYFEQCGFRTMETVDVCSEDSPTLKVALMTRVPFPKSIELE